MLTVCSSPKGGSGVSVTAAALALQIAAAGDRCQLVDLGGDLPAVLGLDVPDQEGVGDWLASGDDVPPDGMLGLEVAVAERLALLPVGLAPVASWSSDRIRLLGALMSARPGQVVVDAGPVGLGPWPDSAARITVVRSCYLAVQRLLAEPERAGRVVLIEEPGRALTRRDLDRALGGTAVVLRWDPAVARAVDAGLLAHRLPRSLRALRVVLPGSAGSIR